jgi:hypothetical protein
MHSSHLSSRQIFGIKNNYESAQLTTKQHCANEQAAFLEGSFEQVRRRIHTKRLHSTRQLGIILKGGAITESLMK